MHKRLCTSGGLGKVDINDSLLAQMEEQLAAKDRQLEAKDEQLAAKDEQIKQLIRVAKRPVP